MWTVDCMAPRRRHDDHAPRARIVALVLLMLLPVAFVGGQAFGRRGPTVREIEATPAPSALPDGVRRFHDASASVTCWSASGALACLPDGAVALERGGR